MRIFVESWARFVASCYKRDHDRKFLQLSVNSHLSAGTKNPQLYPRACCKLLGSPTQCGSYTMISQ